MRSLRGPIAPMPPRTRRVLVALVGLLLLAFAAYKAKRRWDGETLARTLRGPTRLLCPAWHDLEAAGCFGDCVTRNKVNDAKAAMRAARAFLAFPTHPDAEVEARLAVIRTTSAEIAPAVAADCSFDMEPFAQVTPQIERCAATVKATPAIGKLVREVEDLVAFGEERSGAHFLTMRNCAYGLD